MSYDPTKRYTWSPDEKIEMTGSEFALMLNAVRSVLNLPEAKAIILAHQANNVIESLMEKNYNQGKIHPIKEQEK